MRVLSRFRNINDKDESMMGTPQLKAPNQMAAPVQYRHATAS